MFTCGDNAADNSVLKNDKAPAKSEELRKGKSSTSTV